MAKLVFKQVHRQWWNLLPRALELISTKHFFSYIQLKCTCLKVSTIIHCGDMKWDTLKQQFSTSDKPVSAKLFWCRYKIVSRLQCDAWQFSWFEFVNHDIDLNFQCHIVCNAHANCSCYNTHFCLNPIHVHYTCPMHAHKRVCACFTSPQHVP